jgi:hypothetical protein
MTKPESAYFNSEDIVGIGGKASTLNIANNMFLKRLEKRELKMFA